MNVIGFSKFRFKYLTISLITGVWLLLTSIPISGAQDLEGSLGWKSYGLVGDIVYAPVRLDGHDLFSIAAERKQDNNAQWGWGALQIRRNRIENRLKSQVRYLIENGVDPESLQVITTQLNRQMAVQLVLDGKATKPIVTVTALDAEMIPV